MYNKTLHQSETWKKTWKNGSAATATITAKQTIRLSLSSTPSKTKRHRTILADQLERIFSQPIDEPLSNQRTDKILSPVTSPIDDENVPPQTNLMIIAEDDNCSMDTIITPPNLINGIGNTTPPDQPAYMARLQRDLNSPSATARVRALKAIKAQNHCNYYNFDVPHEQQDIITDEERRAPTTPPTIQDIMKDVVCYVEIRSGSENRSEAIKNVIAQLGAKVNDKLLRNTTHVIFSEGLQSTYNKAKSWNIPIVSILWIEKCKTQLRLVDPMQCGISNVERYENPELYPKTKVQKFLQPVEFGTPTRTNGTPSKTKGKRVGTPSKPPKQIVNGKTNIDKPVGEDKTEHRPDSVMEISGTLNDFCDNSIRRSARRRTVHTLKAMEETVIPSQNSTDFHVDNSVPSTPTVTMRRKQSPLINSVLRRQIQTVSEPVKSITKRRTLFTPNPVMSIDQSACLESSSQLIDVDAVTTPIRKGTVESVDVPETPDNPIIRQSAITTNKRRTIFEDYSENLKTFRSAKIPTNKRRTLFDISMDIIDQRLENINKTCATGSRLNRSASESDITDVDEQLSQQTNQISISSPQLIKQPEQPVPIRSKSTKRKLFAPVHMYDLILNEDEAIELSGNNSKRGRDDPESDRKFNGKKVKLTEPIKKLTSSQTSRRTTMHFQNRKKLTTEPMKARTCVKKLPTLVTTYMHQNQIDFVKKALKTLGGFRMTHKVTEQTTHVIIPEPSRTINLLRGIIHGAWIVSYNWVVESMAKQQWLPEEPFEIVGFSSAISLSRGRRQAFGSTYRIDIFSDIGLIYIASDCSCPDLKELIELAGGQCTDSRLMAKYLISKKFIEGKGVTLNQTWILDSISNGQIEPIKKYLIDESR